MFKNVPGRVAGAAVVVALFSYGCQARSPVGPAPGPTQPAATGIPQPIVRSIVPASASTIDPTRVTIHGEWFDPGATVMIGGTRTNTLRVTMGDIDVMTPAHAAGVVDVVVTNPDGQSGRLIGGFAFEDIPATVPFVETISPARGVTTGGTSVVISGTGFDAGTSVRVDGVSVRTFLWRGSLSFTTFAHDPGTVDIVVTNAAGTARRPGGFTYAKPDDFNFNGTWKGFADGPPETQVEMSFTIANDVLVSVSCGSVTLTPAPDVKVRSGEFSYQGESGNRLTARILSEVTASGEIHVPPCGPTWFAWKQ